MFSRPVAAYCLFALLALLPGVVSWLSGRRLARLVESPALPELLAANHRRNGVLFVLAIAGIGYAATWFSTSFALPLVVGTALTWAGLIAAAYPLRRALYNETWSFGSYFWFYPRLIVGIFGFWLLLIALPGLVSLAGSWDWIAGVALAAVLILWNVRYADVVRACLRARPIAEGDFVDRCRALADTCGVPQPRFERVDLQGGVVANALALPSLRTSSVLFTDVVLDRFDQRELLAICAHEIAHFEHYNPAFLRRLNRVSYSLIALGALSGPLLRISGVDLGLMPTVVWFFVLLGAMALRARDKQRQETACDLRAVELTGDADAVVRGLTRLYTLARIPRRMQNERERAASHPSLARRIRDIRKAAGAAPVSIGGAHTFTSPDGRASVTFDEGELRWAEGDGVTHSVGYTNLTELRVDPRRGPRLVALGAGSKRWAMRIADPDLARLETVLDAVDDKLADPPRPPSIPRGLQRPAILMAAVMFFTLTHAALAGVALLAWLKPSLPLLAGAGFGALAAAALLLRDHPDFTYAVWMTLPVATFAIMLLAFGWMHRHEDRDAELRPFVALMSIAAVILVLAIAINGIGVVRLHQAARETPSAPVLLTALAATLLSSKSHRLRLIGRAAGCAALAAAVLGSTLFLDRFAQDPFIVDAPTLERVSIAGTPSAEFGVPADTSRIDLSPSGAYVITEQNQTDVDDDEEGPSTFEVGRIGQAAASITADDLTFADDDRLLAVEGGPRDTKIRLLKREAPHDVLWERTLDDITAPSLSYAGATGTWRVTGWAADRSIVRAEGTIGGAGVEVQRWPAGLTRGSYVQALTTAGTGALILEKRYERRLIDRLIPLRWTWARMLVRTYDPISRYATLTDGAARTLGESKLDADCLPDVLDTPALVCAVDDGARTHIAAIDAATGHLEPIAVLDGRFVANQNVERGWLTGWAGSRPVAIRLSTRQAFQVPGYCARANGCRRCRPAWGTGFRPCAFSARLKSPCFATPTCAAAPPDSSMMCATSKGRDGTTRFHPWTSPRRATTAGTAAPAAAVHAAAPVAADGTTIVRRCGAATRQSLVKGPASTRT